MPGWQNVWTMPIQNRVDMLATGINTPIGVRVLGRNLEDIVKASERSRAGREPVPGAVNVVADRSEASPISRSAWTASGPRGWACGRRYQRR